MEPINIDNYKMCFITKIGHKIDLFLAMYRQYGFKLAILTSYKMISIQLFKFMYKRFAWYRKRFKSKLGVTDSWTIQLFDMFIMDDEFDIQKAISMIPEEEMDKWKEQTAEIIEKEIKVNNITDENQIENLYKTFGLEYHKNTENEL